ncbi:putative HC-toxin efflux carrier TOXA 13 [Paramyrothecium foliicola]|nr:putative HC-toxin efflux carrier TOXA 13 [Paramyrothecium foliicola]
MAESVNEKETLGPGGGAEHEAVDYPAGLKLGTILASVFLCMFLTSLDRLIVVTAIPKITDEFHSVNDIGWYGSAFLLLQCSSQLMFGKVYTVFTVKGTFLISLLLFEIGSTVCGAAPNSIAFILGRAIAGLGAAGIQSGVIVVIVHSVPLHKRPMYQGLFAAVFGVSSVVGPLLGGALTTNATWRWCFYINLPLGGVAAVAVYFLLTIPERSTTKLSLKEKLTQLDFPGTMMIVPGCVCLILALQWGGSTYHWNSGRIIALLVVAGVLLIGFVLVQAFLPKTATVPPRIVKQRSIRAGLFATICVGGQLMIFAYYLPVWFQGIQGVSAVESGIRFLPTMLSIVVASIFTGALIRRTGYYTPFMIFGICIMAVGGGLLYTLQVNTPSPRWIGYQILYGFGSGCAMQAPNLAAQTVLAKEDVSIGIALMLFGQLLGGTIFVSVAQNVLSNQLLQRLSSLPGLDPETILDTGATSLVNLPSAIKPKVLLAYNESLRHVFLVGLVLICLAIFGAVSLEWRSMRKDVPAQTEQSKGNEQA